MYYTILIYDSSTPLPCDKCFSAPALAATAATVAKISH